MEGEFLYWFGQFVLGDQTTDACFDVQSCLLNIVSALKNCEMRKLEIGYPPSHVVEAIGSDSALA
jgi:hypothetical protein